jgi:hypothetical protein
MRPGRSTPLCYSLQFSSKVVTAFASSSGGDLLCSAFDQRRLLIRLDKFHPAVKMAVDDSASSITVAVRVRPFTIREAAQLVKADDGPVFLGDGSLVAAPPKLASKGLRPIIKVVDDKCLCVHSNCGNAADNEKSL